MSGPASGPAFTAEYNASFNSFSGVDMRVMFGSIEIGELQGVSVTVTREKAPLYVMGSPNPRAFSRGKRGIAGSLIFLIFDRDAFIAAMRGSKQGGFKPWNHEGSYLQDAAGDGVRTLTGTPNANEPQPPISQTKKTKNVAKAWYADQILPFDIVITAENEYGAAATTSIIGCEILNAGSGMSVDDITTDTNMTFVARECVPWTPVGLTPALADVKKLAKKAG